MALESENSDPRAGHVVAAAELNTPHDPVDTIAEEHIAGWTANKTEQPIYPIDVAKLTEEQRNKIAEDVRNFERLNQMIADNNDVADANEALERRRAQSVAAGGGMQPPTEPTNENTLSSLDAEALDRQTKVELENFSLKRENAQIKTGLEQKLAGDMIAEMMVPEAKVDTQPSSDTEKMRTIMEGKFGSMNASTSASAEQAKTSKADTRAGEIGLQAVENALPLTRANKIEAAPISKQEVTQINSQERWKHDLFGRLGARFERMGIKIKNAPKWTAFETMRRFHAEGAAKIQVKLEAQKKEVETIEAQLAKREADAKARAETMQSGGFFDRLAAAKLERERQNVLSKLEKAKATYGQIEATLEFKNKKLANYQDRLTHQADTIAAGVDQRLAGDRADFETLTAKQEDITQKLNSLKQTIETVQNDLLLWEVRLKNKPEAAEKAEIKNGIAETKKKLADLVETYTNLGTDKSRIQAMASRAKLYLSGWDGMRSPTQ